MVHENGDDLNCALNTFSCFVEREIPNLHFQKLESRKDTYFMPRSHLPDSPQTSSASSVLANPAQPGEIQLFIPWILREEAITLAIAIRMNDTREPFVWSKGRARSQPIIVAVANCGLFPVAVASPVRARTDVDAWAVALGDVLSMLVVVLLLRSGCEDRASGEDGHQGNESVCC